MMESYRGHRIEAISAGVRGWVAYVDMHEVGTGMSKDDALGFARRWVDDVIWSHYVAKHGPELRRPTPLRAVPVLRLVPDADRDRDERMSAGIGSVDEQRGWE